MEQVKGITAFNVLENYRAIGIFKDNNNNIQMKNNMVVKNNGALIQSNGGGTIRNFYFKDGYEYYIMTSGNENVKQKAYFGDENFDDYVTEGLINTMFGTVENVNENLSSFTATKSGNNYKFLREDSVNNTYELVIVQLDSNNNVIAIHVEVKGTNNKTESTISVLTSEGELDFPDLSGYEDVTNQQM